MRRKSKPAPATAPGERSLKLQLAVEVNRIHGGSSRTPRPAVRRIFVR
jgi:hypothetical protein